MTSTMPGAHLELRLADENDETALRELFGSSRAAEFGLLPPAVRDQLLELQYRAQRSQYSDAFPHAVYEIIEIDGLAIGRMITATTADGIRLVDLAIAAAHQGRGVGTSVLGRLCTRADAARKRVELTVWAQNGGARRLYERLGFAAGQETGGYLAMSRPTGAAS
jgi:ribosomal protein S18 acetylase RimI-like enzyme